MVPELSDDPVDEIRANSPQVEFELHQYWSAIRDSMEPVFQGIVHEPQIVEIFYVVFDEIHDQYQGEFLDSVPSDLGVLLILAKKSLYDERFQDFDIPLREVAEQLSRTITANLQDFETIGISAADESLRGRLVTMKLALKLDQDVLIIPSPNHEPLAARLTSFPLEQHKAFVRMWFTFDSEILSARVKWEDLPTLVERDVWDLTGTG